MRSKQLILLYQATQMVKEIKVMVVKHIEVPDQFRCFKKR